MPGGEAFWLPLGEAASGGGAGEVLMADGITPPEPLTNEAGTDWLYEDG